LFSALYKVSKQPLVGSLVNFVGYGYLALWNRLFAHVPSYNFRYFVAKYLYGVKIGRSNLQSGVRMLSPWNITVGDNVNIQMGCFLDGRGGIVIGDNVDVTIGVKIFTQQHDIQSPNYDTVTRRVEIGNDAVIGSFSMILPGVTIGRGAVVGAGSVVPKSIAAFEMHAGNPAVFKRRRNETIAYRLNYRRPFH
jgi:putative colanic acid biosynthesis acetyltransferase WcaF